MHMRGISDCEPKAAAKWARPLTLFHCSQRELPPLPVEEASAQSRFSLDVTPPNLNRRTPSPSEPQAPPLSASASTLGFKAWVAGMSRSVTGGTASPGPERVRPEISGPMPAYPGADKSSEQGNSGPVRSSSYLTFPKNADFRAIS